MNAITRHDLKDLTFIIPLRIDSAERQENLETVISYLLRHFETNIMVLEADKEGKAKLPDAVQKIFIEDEDPIFHHSHYRNVMIKKATTEFIALWDADAIAPADQVIKACKKLRNKETDLVFPYDGRYYQTHTIFKNMYKDTMDVEILKFNIGKMYLMYGMHFIGGAIMMNRQIYCDAGMENENFYGWSPEDFERIFRCEILGYRISRIDGPLFHLCHPKGNNSWFFSNETNIKSKNEILKICGMTPGKLRNYVNSNEWPAKMALWS